MIMCWNPETANPSHSNCPCGYCTDYRRQRWAESRARQRARTKTEPVVVAPPSKYTRPNGGVVRVYTDAACADVSKDLFFPLGESRQFQVQIAEAKKVCKTCPHKRECRDEARTAGLQGIWGGETESERRRAGFPVREATNPMTTTRGN